ncbi:MAG: HEAT repeat domain-containing protein [Motiliproteus sp.]
MTERNDVIKALIQLLGNGDEADRCYAARALGTLADNQATDTLIERLRDEDIDVCVDAATALGDIGDARATPALIESLMKDPDGEIKTAATEALGKIADPLAIDTLIEVAKERPEGLEADDGNSWDDYWDIQLKAVQALGQCGAQKTSIPLCAIIDNDELQDIESEVLSALSQGDSACIDALITRATSATTRSRRRAVKALGRSQSPLAKTSIIAALRDDDADVRAEAIAALARLEATDQLNRIFDCLKDPIAQVRAEAIKGLINLANVHGTNSFGPEVLFPLLETEDKLVKAAILEALCAKMKNSDFELEPSLLPVLLASLKSDNYDEAVAACALLGHVNSREVRRELVGLMQNDEYDGRLRQQAVRSLGQHQNRELEAVMALLQAVNDENAAIRVSAIETLYQLQQASANNEDSIQPEEPLQLLLSLMRGGDPLAALEAAIQAHEIQQAEQQLQQEQATQPAADDSQRINAIQLDGDAPSLGYAAALQAVDNDSSNTASNDDDMELVEYSELENDTKFSAGSTLDAINMDNFEVMTASSDDRPEDEKLLGLVDELPEDMQDFGDVVREHLKTGDRIFATKKGRPVSEDTRLLIIRTLADSEDATVIESLILTLSDKDLDVCREAALALALIAARNHQAEGISNAFGALVMQLQFDNQDLRLACLRALGALQHKEGIVPVLDSLKDPSSSVRIEAIKALQALSQSEYSDDPNSHHMVLEKIDQKDIVMAIRPLLEDTETGVRKAAVESLAALGDLASVDQMIDAGLYNHGALATPVAHSLTAMDLGEISSKLLLRLSSSPESSQRRFVIEMLETLFCPEKHSAAV